MLMSTIPSSYMAKADQRWRELGMIIETIVIIAVLTWLLPLPECFPLPDNIFPLPGDQAPKGLSQNKCINIPWKLIHWD
jgi:hypothetical protein